MLALPCDLLEPHPNLNPYKPLLNPPALAPSTLLGRHQMQMQNELCGAGNLPSTQQEALASVLVCINEREVQQALEVWQQYPRPEWQQQLGVLQEQLTGGRLPAPPQKAGKSPARPPAAGLPT